MLAIGLANFLAIPTLSTGPLAAGAALGFTSCANAALAESVATTTAALIVLGVLKVFINGMDLMIRI
jgi:hypothetical protein